MRIGVDVDGVLTNLEEYQLKYGKKYFGEEKLVNPKAYDITDIFGVSKEEREKFWTKYIWKYCLKDEPKINSSETIRKLKEDGDKIYIITGRAHTTEENALGKIFRKMLISWLRKNDIPYEDIIFCDESKSASDKFEACKKLNIDVMLEDKAENIEEISKLCDVICFNAAYNEDYKNDKIYRVNTYEEAYENIKKIREKREFKLLTEEERSKLPKEEKIEYYKKLKEYYKNLPYDFKKMEKSERNYKIAVKTGIPIFNLIYKPNIVNKELIPEGNGHIFVSNHLGSLDQFPIMSAIGSRPIHFMAASTLYHLKRGLLYRNTGSIFVDRESKESREEAAKLMNQILVNGGNIFVFPEGTRNMLKDSDYEELYLLIQDICEKDELINNLSHKHFRKSQINKLKELLNNDVIDKYTFKDILLSQDKDCLIKLLFEGVITQKEYDDSLLLPFKLGVASMAKKTNSLIVPFAVNNNYGHNDGPLIVRAGEPMKIKPEDDIEEKTLELHDTILNMIHENNKLEKVLKLKK